jgi:hypothetical protein
MAPAHFFVGATIDLEWQTGIREEIPWELFRGRLLDPAHTRERQAFESWQVFRVADGVRAGQPLVSVKLDSINHVVYVTRGILCHVCEGYDAGNRVFLSREVRKWVRELVAVLPLADLPTTDELRDELLVRILQAVVGTNRLPLTSVEAPLPEFSLGELAYCYRSHEPTATRHTGPARSPGAFLDRSWGNDLAWLEKIKLLETLLRATPAGQMAAAARHWLERLGAPGSIEPSGQYLRGLFNEVALSPYTDFVPKTMTFLDFLVARGGVSTEDQIDFLGYLLRQLSRHLTAYDLVTFHQRGANYPDILVIDEVLKRYMQLADAEPHWFEHVEGEPEDQDGRRRLRRRGLRQGYCLRRQHEGHLVTEVPTSPGENNRVLPPPHSRVSDEQILEPARRTKQLFSNEPLAPYRHEQGRALWEKSVLDLGYASELQELGMAIFLDRPLGVFKDPLEPDQTLLMSYEMFSRSLALGRLESWSRTLGSPATTNAWKQSLRELEVPGLVPEPPAGPPRPGGVSLADALQVASDFLVLGTTRKSLADFLLLFDFSALGRRCDLDFLTSGRPVLIVRGPAPVGPPDGRLRVFDAGLRPRLELRINRDRGYAHRGGWEYPAAGLQVLRIWEADGSESFREQRLSFQVCVRSW